MCSASRAGVIATCAPVAPFPVRGVRALARGAAAPGGVPAAVVGRTVLAGDAGFDESALPDLDSRGATADAPVSFLSATSAFFGFGFPRPRSAASGACGAGGLRFG